MAIYARVFGSISVAAVLLLGSGTVRAETTSETNPASPATIVIVDPLDGAGFDAPASFTVRIESENGSSDTIDTVSLQIDGEPVGASCQLSGVCNVEVVDLAVGTHVLVAVALTISNSIESEPVKVTVEAGAETESATGTETGSGASEAGAETADPTGGEAPTTGGGSETGGDSDATDDGLGSKGCGCVSGGGGDPLALGLLLVGGALVRRRRA